MLTILSRYMPDASPWVFLVLFAALLLIIVGGALWLTPRLAKWLDERRANNKSYYDGMLEEDPNQPKEPEDAEKPEERHV